jgi:hypothetical protein
MMSRTRIVNYEKGDLIADSHSIMVRCKNCFSQILNVHGVSDVRQAEIHTAKPTVPEPSALEVELAIENYHHHHISVMELGHLSTRSGLTHPEVSSKVCHDSFCQLGNSVSLPWVIY